MRRISFAILVVCFGVSCSNKYSAYLPLYAFPHSKSSPDYSDINYWAAHPWKKDPSDSVPSGLNDKSRDSLVDVFFIHPTTYINKKKSWNADINDGYMNAKTDYTTVLYQASAFNQYARVFAPRYRQAHFSAFFAGDSAAAAAFDTAYADVKKAFEYYLQHHNNGKPMIIAGHSQGAMLGKRLLKEFFD